VLATPVICHWFETASVLAVAEFLEAGEATVGTRLSVEHLKATPLGMVVRVEAEVTAVEGRRLAFAIEAHDQAELVARGSHERYVVDLGRFLQGVEAKAVTRR
jgi:fluoroacetyl-CoA thioesterase